MHTKINCLWNISNLTVLIHHRPLYAICKTPTPQNMVKPRRMRVHAAQKPAPRSCDTFVALPDATADGSIIFGKNSDRPTEEVQSVEAFPRQQHAANSAVQCTYISIPQVGETAAVILSKPTWMWGAEMGANEYGVVIGNEAVWTVERTEEKGGLLGMDLLRLGLERSKTAEQAVLVITSLLEKHGQGGGCEEGGNWTYHNSFLIADAECAWVLETAGKWWAAEKITQGVRNISNCLSIRNTYHLSSKGLREHAQSAGYLRGPSQGPSGGPSEGPIDFAAAFSEGGAPPLGKLSSGREANGRKLLEAVNGRLGPQEMADILRNEYSGICMCGGGGFRTNGAQVSRIALKADGSVDAVHWFTATPDPQCSVFKPFVFDGAFTGSAPYPSEYTVAQPANTNPPMLLWQAWQIMHEGAKPKNALLQSLKPNRAPSRQLLRQLEERYMSDTIQKSEDSESAGNDGVLSAYSDKLHTALKGVNFATVVEQELQLMGCEL